MLPIIVKSVLVVQAYIVREIVTANVRRAEAKTIYAPFYEYAVKTDPQIAATKNPKLKVNRNIAI